MSSAEETLAEVVKILGGYPDSDPVSLATTVAAGYDEWEQLTTMWKELTIRCNEMGKEIIALRAALKDAESERDAAMENMTTYQEAWKRIEAENTALRDQRKVALDAWNRIKAERDQALAIIEGLPEPADGYTNGESPSHRAWREAQDFAKRMRGEK